MQSDIGREGTIDRRAPAVEASMARLADEAQGAGERPGVDDQLSRLMDLLVALRVDLTTGLMPRAARITGTSDRLYAAVDYVDAAIRVARNAAIQLQVRS